VVLITWNDPQPTGWLKAKVVEVAQAPGRLYHIRIAFSRPCPEEFLPTAPIVAAGVVTPAG